MTVNVDDKKCEERTTGARDEERTTVREARKQCKDQRTADRARSKKSMVARSEKPMVFARADDGCKDARNGQQV